ncbi:oxidoreductase family protein [Arcticibacter tournemirensis]|uniref:Gfo/Idh/MocA family oxidoreductase n=1 Tax=Arcticibacter tournemirensis TaxID=699437 RepID=A0A5M9GZW5_9SPHI|nr:Gfo/Idh/MocA family oxidoreductase [Arcticibacter tournemirensis]KAA8480192.1 Gfo/Idh/MocA family oxidoreductase [Arcticibacter tournemirensis]TQM52674.1 oxidoreductase family protein [Arcticibacter tournemirensis]
MNRRNLLKTLGISVGATVISAEALAKLSENKYAYTLPENPLHKPLSKPVTAIILGAGNRGTVYGSYAVKFPEQLKIVGVAEPIPLRNERHTKLHKIVESNRFNTWEDVFKRPKFADAVIISTPDNLHYAPCMKALEMGYDILLEKPIAPTEKECRDILALAKKKGRIVGVCHVLRYAPYFVKMKELIAKGAIGEIISIQHFEPIEHTHMAHSYVRGNWHNSKATTPIILAKSCHDLDIIKWVIDKPAKEIVAMGDLKWFKKENAPEGSTARCTDGCKVERECPYSAIKEYYERRSRTSVLDLPEDKSKHAEVIMERLKTTNYGRCVYRMENDQPDHYVTSILFGDNVTANFSMEAFTSYHGRRTRVMGSMGDMVGDMEELVITDFRSRKELKLVPTADDVEGYKNSGHGGGDLLLVRDFVQAVAQQNPKLLTSTIDESIESHIMGFMAEESRKNKKVMSIKI